MVLLVQRLWNLFWVLESVGGNLEVHFNQKEMRVRKVSFLLNVEF